MEVNSDTTAKKEKHSWFSRRRRPFFSRRIGRCGSKKKNERSSSSSFEPVSSASGDSSKMDPGITTATIHPAKEHPVKNYSSNSEETAVSIEFKSGSQECSVCLVTQPLENFPQLSSCQHHSCLSCLRQYLTIEISESRVNLTCPECQERLHPADMRSILENEPVLLMKWEEFMLRRTLSTDPDCRWCPAPDCGFAVIAYGCASCPRLVCHRPGCNTEFCYHCRQEWHHNQTCDSAHLQRTRQLRMRTNSAAYSQGSFFHDEIKPCPKCGALIVKMNDGSCNHMTCTVCEAEFCWLCLQEINDLHYLSPSGCTFWGKKPWSRKKKILWQLGLLIGAPVGISLVAGVAVPAIIFGVPVWVARKVFSQLDNRNVSKHKRNLVVATCAFGSLLLSPALAALVVGLGVPIMLLFVYGVVPFSLCRSGGSGPSGRGLNTPGASMLPAAFRLDLGNTSNPTSPTSQDEGTNYHGQSSRLVPTNPSIGEASVGGITMGSFNTSRGSNIDKVGRVDQDGASTMAMAGTSITGSLSGISGAGALGSNRMENPSSDVDQHSTHTQVSVGSASGVTSVQIHMSDNISDHSTSSFPTSSGPNNVKRAYSSKSLGAKRKTKMTKRSSSVKAITSSKTVATSVDTSVAKDVSDVTIATKQDNPYTLTIVNECETTENKSLPPAASSSSPSSSFKSRKDSASSDVSSPIDSSHRIFPKVSRV